jgi:glucose-fructose oxidoreductase
MEESKSEKLVRYAVVGLGHLAQTAVLPAFKNAQNSRLVALVTADPKKRKKLAAKYKIERVYSYEQFDQCLMDGVDAVYLALPNHLHREYAVRAAKARVHVLCEKPMAVSSQECEEMIRAADENQVKLMVAYRLHFEESQLQAINILQQGTIGDVRIFTSEFTQQVTEGNVRLAFPVTQGGGPVYDMGIYCINAARYLMRAEPEEVFATAAQNHEHRFEKAGEMVTVVMRFPGQRLASFTCSLGATDVSRYSLIGTRGVLAAEPAYDYALELRQHLIVEGKRVSRKFPKRDQFAPELLYFSECILNDKEPEPSGLEGLADVRIIEAIYESVKTARPVKVPALPQKKRPELEQQIYRPGHDQPELVNAKPPSGEAA